MIRFSRTRLVTLTFDVWTRANVCFHAENGVSLFEISVGFALIGVETECLSGRIDLEG